MVSSQRIFIYKLITYYCNNIYKFKNNIKYNNNNKGCAINNSENLTETNGIGTERYLPPVFFSIIFHNNFCHWAINTEIELDLWY